jgi:hypothetical protein
MAVQTRLGTLSITKGRFLVMLVLAIALGLILAGILIPVGLLIELFIVGLLGALNQRLGPILTRRWNPIPAPKTMRQW